ncbi:MAG: cytochrome c oxidase assembly factor Coa1 family protein [Archangium sp.]
MNPNPEAPMNPPSWWSRNWKWVVPVGCVVPMLCCLSFVGATYFGVSKAIESSTVFTVALQNATANKDVQEKIGAPLKTGMGLNGSLNETNGNGSADFSVPLEGPRGKGKLRVVATGRNGKWDYSVMEVEASDGTTIDLLAKPKDELPPADDSDTPEPEDPDGD